MRTEKIRIVGLVVMILAIIAGFCLWMITLNTESDTDSNALLPGEYTTGSWYFEVLPDGSLENIRNFESMEQER